MIQEHLMRQFVKTKDDVLKKVIQQVLGREYFTTDEVKDFSFVFFVHHPNREFIGYKGNMIGELKIFYKYEDNQSKVVIEFEPKTEVD